VRLDHLLSKELLGPHPCGVGPGARCGADVPAGFAQMAETLA
jgi:hypothetical protein